MSSKHVWRFFRAGGVDQVVIEKGADIERLSELDLKLWIAIAMPTQGTDLDAKTARFLDTDEDGRIRAQDVLTTIDWLKTHVASLDPIVAGKAEVALDSITNTEMRRTAERIVREAKDEGSVVTLSHVEEAEKRFDAGIFNGDGIITVEGAGPNGLAKIVEDIIATHGSVPDRSGKDGVDAARIDAFFDEVEKLSAWHEEGKTAAIEKPLGDATLAASDRMRSLSAKLDDYYTRCRLAAFDDRASAAAHGAETELATLASRDVDRASPELVRLPLARVLAGQALPFEGPVNPAYAEQLLAFRDTVVRPILGATTNALSEADYRKLLERFASFEAWRARKPETKVDALSRERLLELVSNGARVGIKDLVVEDASHQPERDRIVEVEKLVHLHRDFGRVVRNFVNFADFYGRQGAIFQTGTLYLDGRSCTLCIEVTDAAKHATLAARASTYLAYCELRRKGEANRNIVAGFTAGDSDNLMVGRNGVFIDRAGKDWDATITKIVENPISIRQAFWSPYKKFVRLVEEQVAKRASDAEAQSHARIGAAAESTANVDREAAAAAAPAARPVGASRPKIDVGTVAAIGVAVGGIGAMVTGLVSAFFGLGVFMPLGIVALMLLISGPSMLLAYLKLHRRNLGPLLDASGWAINGLATVNVPFGGALTAVATLPPNAGRVLQDPYAEKKSPIKLYLVLALLVMLLLGWTMGKFDAFLPNKFKAGRVFHRTPAAAPAAPDAASAP